MGKENWRRQELFLTLLIVARNRLIWMICFIKQRTLKRSPRKPWLMLHALLMNLELTKNILLLKRKLNALLSLKLWSLIRDWLKLMKLLPREDAMLWQNLNHASENWKLSLEAYKARLQSLTSASKKLNAVSRNFNSNRMKTTRIKIVCLNWQPSCK